jgi:hypothetical protein
VLSAAGKGMLVVVQEAHCGPAYWLIIIFFCLIIVLFSLRRGLVAVYFLGLFCFAGSILLLVLLLFRLGYRSYLLS